MNIKKKISQLSAGIPITANGNIFSAMVRDGLTSSGLIYQAHFTQSSTNAPTVDTAGRHNPFGLTLGSAGTNSTTLNDGLVTRASAGLYSFVLSDQGTNDIVEALNDRGTANWDVTKIHCQVICQVAARMMTHSVVSATTTVLTTTMQFFDMAATPAAADCAKFLVQVWHV